MKFNRSGLQRTILCFMLYFIFVSFFYDKNLVNGLFNKMSEIIFWVFIVTLIIESILAGYQLQLSYIIISMSTCMIFYVIDIYVSSATRLGYVLYELEKTLFKLPLADKQGFSLVTIGVGICVSYCIGIAIYYAKKQYLVIKSRNDVINELKSTK
ncbi:hypothetical protein [Anaerorhabdus sp.]|jgi:hypothetical protein|uniref:hypothetical protein n=1 Tax=Anaerorhabdus sp. TaxID=1872524 RepID=UPI002FC919A6